MYTKNVRRILKRLYIPLPHTETFLKFNSSYHLGGYHTISNEYGVNPDNIWLTGDWMYTHNNAFFSKTI